MSPLNWVEPYRRVLPNGLRLIVEPISHVRSVAVGLWVGAGSRSEGAGQGGASHFLEHLLFKGTATRSARELAEAIDAVGGDMNAYTTKEYTCYYIRALGEHVPLAMELLADILLNSRFDPEDIDKERGVILEEISLYEDTPDELVHDLLAQCLWGSHPLGRSIIGSAGDVMALTREGLLDFYRTHYHPANAVLAVSGAVDPLAVEELAHRFFGPWPAQEPAQEATVVQAMHRPEPVRPGARRDRRVRVKETEQVHFCLGTEGRAIDHSDRYGLLVLSSLIGGGPSSRLFQAVREERGLAYSVYAFQAAYRDTGMFGVYAGSSPRSAPAVLDLIMAELQAIRRHGITGAELDRAKEQIRTSLLMSLECTESRMSRLGRCELLLGRVPAPEAVIQEVSALRQEDIAALAGQVLDPDHLSLAAVAPTPEPFPQ